MTKSSLKLNLICFIFVFLGLLGLIIYQVFVSPKFTRLPFHQFFKTSTISKLFYKIPDIGQPLNFSTPNPLTLNCQPNCIFKLNNQSIPAMVDNDPEALITNVILKFFDNNLGLIGYENNDPDNPTFYVLNLNGQLLQTIRLNLNQLRLLKFINYYPKTREIMFKSTHQKTKEVKHWLYRADQPSLRQINL